MQWKNGTKLIFNTLCTTFKLQASSPIDIQRDARVMSILLGRLRVDNVDLHQSHHTTCQCIPCFRECAPYYRATICITSSANCTILNAVFKPSSTTPSVFPTGSSSAFALLVLRGIGRPNLHLLISG